VCRWVTLLPITHEAGTSDGAVERSRRMIRIICAHVSARGNQVLGGDGNLCFLFFVYDVVPKGGWKESNVGVRRRS
jgi:hypothetical protein